MSAAAVRRARTASLWVREALFVWSDGLDFSFFMGSPLIGQGVALPVIRGLFRSKKDDQVIGKTGDGKERIAPKALVHAKLVRTVGGDDGDAAASHLNDVFLTLWTADRKGLTRRYLP